MQWCIKLTGTNRSRAWPKNSLHSFYVQLSKIFGDTPITKYDIRFPGDYSGEATPVPIPNTAVKLSSADGTALTCGRVGRCQDLYFSVLYTFCTGIKFTFSLSHCGRRCSGWHLRYIEMSWNIVGSEYVVPVFILSLKRRLCEMQGLFLFFTGAYHVFRESIVYVYRKMKTQCMSS